MARKDNSPLSLMYEIASILPWWLGVILAIAAYFGLHHYAVQPIPVMDSRDPGALAPHILSSAFHSAAKILQYLVPLFLVAGAMASFIAQFKRRRMLAGVKDNTIQIADLSWLKFEQLIGEVFRDKGYTVAERGGHGGDGGVDLVLRKDNQKALVQCKHWKSGKVAVSVVRELLGSMTAESAQAGIVVASDGFTHEATHFAKKHNIELIGGDELRKLFSRAQPEPQVQLSSVAVPNTSSPNCPKCGSKMKLRTARKGVNAGGQFWGCSRFPGCRGVVSG